MTVSTENITDRDNVASDLLQILADTKAELRANPKLRITDTLMQRLCSYVSRRDSKIFNHAFNAGKKAAAEQLKVEGKILYHESYGINDGKE